MNFKMCLSFLIFALTANNVSTRIIDMPTNSLANSIGATLSNTGSQVRLENDGGTPQTELSKNGMGSMPVTILGDRVDEETGNEGTGDEETGNEGTGDEETGNEGTGDEETGNEGTGDEETGNEGTGDEDTGNEGTGDEETGNEGTGDEDTCNEGTGDEDTGNEGTGAEENGTEQVGNNDGAPTIELSENKIGLIPSIVSKLNLSNQETGNEQVGNPDGARPIELSKNGIVPMPITEKNAILGTKDNKELSKKGPRAEKTANEVLGMKALGIKKLKMQPQNSINKTF